MTQPITKLCLEADQRLGLQVPKRWREQPGLDLVCQRVAVGENVERDRDMDGYGSSIRSGEGGWEREGVDVGDGDSE